MHSSSLLAVGECNGVSIVWAAIPVGDAAMLPSYTWAPEHTLSRGTACTVAGVPHVSDLGRLATGSRLSVRTPGGLVRSHWDLDYGIPLL